MSSTQEDMDQVQDQLKELEIGQATQAAALAGAQTTQAAAHAEIGMFLGMAVAKARN